MTTEKITVFVVHRVIDAAGYDDSVRNEELGLIIDRSNKMIAKVTGTREALSFMADDLITRASATRGYEHDRKTRRLMREEAESILQEIRNPHHA